MKVQHCNFCKKDTLFVEIIGATNGLVCGICRNLDIPKVEPLAPGQKPILELTKFVTQKEMEKTGKGEWVGCITSRMYITVIDADNDGPGSYYRHRSQKSFRLDEVGRVVPIPGSLYARWKEAINKVYPQNYENLLKFAHEFFEVR